MSDHSIYEDSKLLEPAVYFAEPVKTRAGLL